MSIFNRYLLEYDVWTFLVCFLLFSFSSLVPNCFKTGSHAHFSEE